MNVQFDWQVGTEDGEWETLTRTERRRWLRWVRRVPWRTWAIAAILLVAGAAIAYLALKLRYDEARRRIAFQIQSVIDLEAQAFARRDVALFLSQQDRASPQWFTQQATRIQPACHELREEDGDLDRWPLLEGGDPCSPVLPAEIQDVELRGDVAWVEVIEGQELVRRARFYRQTSLGWKRTVPRVEFWKAPVEVRRGGLVIQYYRRDQPYVEPLLATIAESTERIKSILDFSAPTRGLKIVFAIEPSALSSFFQEEARRDDPIVLSSPWLSGIPVEGEWEDPYVEDLDRRITYELASRSAQSSASPGPNALQKAVADEYAAWAIHGDTAQAPILGRIIERQGEEALPQVFLSLRGTSLLSFFLVRWLSLHPIMDEVAFFETLLNIEREALLLGRRDTFLLLQDATTPEWVAAQRRLFAQTRSGTASPSLASVKVQSVQLDGEYARIALVPASQSDAGVRAAEDLAFFVRRNEDWKHTSPAVSADPTIETASLYFQSGFWVTADQ